MRRPVRCGNPPQLARPQKAIMLKITVRTDPGVVVFELEGKLAGPWVKELEHSWRPANGTQKISHVRVDLSSVTFIDQEGKDLLKKMYREGAKLVTTGCLNKSIVEGIMRRTSEKDA
jgi:anti-anti-sigma regulatory factor